MLIPYEIFFSRILSGYCSRVWLSSVSGAFRGALPNSPVTRVVCGEASGGVRETLPGRPKTGSRSGGALCYRRCQIYWINLHGCNPAKSHAKTPVDIFHVQVLRSVSVKIKLFWPFGRSLQTAVPHIKLYKGSKFSSKRLLTPWKSFATYLLSVNNFPVSGKTQDVLKLLSGQASDRHRTGRGRTLRQTPLLKHKRR